MKPWIVMTILLVALVGGRWFLSAYPGVIEASGHIGSLLSSSSAEDSHQRLDVGRIAMDLPTSL